MVETINWYAVSRGALDLRNFPLGSVKASVAVTAIWPAEPILLAGDVGTLWLRLVNGPVADTDLTKAEQTLVREFEEFGIASRNGSSSRRTTNLERPQLLSFTHELVYGLLATLALDEGIDVVFIKGPKLYKQGLRNREHSGDVDILVRPSQVDRLAELLTRWGWGIQPDLWDGTPINHSVTLTPSGWGCEIDMHRHMPGSALSDADAFDQIFRESDLSRIASVDAYFPAITMHAVISAMHTMRPEFSSTPNPLAFNEAQRILERAGVGTVEAAKSLRADLVLRDVLTATFPTATIEPDYPIPKNWHWRSQPGKARGYLAALRQIPWRDRPRMVSKIIWPSADVIETSQTLAGENSKPGVKSRLQRYLRGFRALRRK